MRKLQLVKGNAKEDQPRQGRGAVARVRNEDLPGAVSGERRYRYPAEEIWEVSDDRWRAYETPHRH